MSYYDVYKAYKGEDWAELAVRSADREIREFASLLLPAAEKDLEGTAARAHEITLRNFGRTIQLYTPIYIANYCENACRYCGFNTKNKIKRRRLTPEELRTEAVNIASTGLEHVLVLAGESRDKSPLSYIKYCVGVLKEYFSSISIEISPLTVPEYTELIGEGVDGLTVYQEVYDEGTYKEMHLAGPKRDYRFRLDAPERGAIAGMRSVNIGALLGLEDWRKEAFLVGLHARYLQDKYPEVEIGLSIPRLKPEAGGFNIPCKVSDKNLVQMVVAMRIFLPRAGISLSTRESPELRDHLVALGITRMSAGSKTSVGGHATTNDRPEGSRQFDISDPRSVDQIRAMLSEKGYQPVLKDWVRI